jgi:hypothetical protein
VRVALLSCLCSASKDVVFGKDGCCRDKKDAHVYCLQLYAILEKEKLRQRSGLELIASENFASASVLEVNGSCLTNKYSEVRPCFQSFCGVLLLVCQCRVIPELAITVETSLLMRVSVCASLVR